MGGTAAAPIWMTTLGRYGSTACAMLPSEADRGRTEQKAPEEPDSTVVVPPGDLCLGRHRFLLPRVRSNVIVCSATSTKICASAPSAPRYAARVLISMSS